MQDKRTWQLMGCFQCYLNLYLWWQLFLIEYDNIVLCLKCLWSKIRSKLSSNVVRHEDFGIILKLRYVHCVIGSSWICVSVSIQSSKHTSLYLHTVLICISRHAWSGLFRYALNSLLWTHSNKHQRVFCYMHIISVTYSKFLDRICNSTG